MQVVTAIVLLEDAERQLEAESASSAKVGLLTPIDIARFVMGVRLSLLPIDGS